MSFSLLPRKLSRALVGASILLVTTAPALPADAQAPSTSTSKAKDVSGYRSDTSTHFKDPEAILGSNRSSRLTPRYLDARKGAGDQFIYQWISLGNKREGHELSVSQKAKALNAGFFWGGEHLAHPDKSDGASQADLFVENGGGWKADGKTLPGSLALGGTGGSCSGLDQEQMRTWIKAFQNRYQQRTGRFPVIKAHARWWNKCVGKMPEASRSPLIIPEDNPAAPSIPTGGWKAYDFWVFDFNQTLTVGDTMVWGGDRAQFMDFVKNANYKPLGVRPVAPGSTPVRAPFGPQDLAAVEPGSGKVYRYADGAQTLGKPSLAIPQGWNSVVSVHVSDVNRDGIRDLVSQWKSGNLAISYGRKDGMFAPAQVIGRGWAGLDMTVGQYAVGENFDSILASDSQGALRRYSLRGGKLTYQGVIGQGWKNLKPRLIQTDGVGAQEIVAQYPDATLRVYHRYNNGKFVPRPAVIAARNWSSWQQGALAASGNIWMVKDPLGNMHRFDFVKDRLVRKTLLKRAPWQHLMVAGSRNSSLRGSFSGWNVVLS